MQSIPFSRVARFGLGLAVAAALGACGGGGGGGEPAGGAGSGLGAGAGSGADDTLSIGFSLSGSVGLFQPVVIRPTITGLEGHAADCSLVSGTVPPGLSLNRDCSITGTPTQAGAFPVTISLGVAGVSNRLELQGAVGVAGPSLVYSMPSTLFVSGSVDVPTLNNFWFASAADLVTYSVEGSLPPGLAIDARTGRIGGAATTEGSYEFRVAVRAENAGRVSTQMQAEANHVTVQAPRIFYNPSTAWVGLPFAASPLLADGPASFRYSVSSLPEGLSMDPATGTVSGVARAPQQFASEHTVTVSTADTGAFVATASLRLDVMSPVYIFYGSSGGGFDASVPTRTIDMLPTIVNNSQQPLDGVIGYSYALAPGFTLPDGVTLDALTGRIAGTVPLFFSSRVTVDVTTTLNGITIVEPLDVFL